MSPWDSILRMIRAKTRVTPIVGTYVGPSGMLALVDAGGGRFPAKTATPYRPEVGESVWVAFIDEVPFVLGPTTTKPGMGVVLSVTSSLASVQTDIGPVTASYTAGQTLSAGQLVKLLWNEGPHIVGVLASALPARTPPEAPNPAAAARHTDTFYPDSSRSWNATSGWWQAQVLADDADLGAWFYGTQISDTIGGGAVSAMEIFITAETISGTPNFAYHAYPTVPDGQPTLTSPTAIDVAEGAWVPLPIEFGTFLASTPGGIGISHGGASKFLAVSDDGQSGALRITSTY